MSEFTSLEYLVTGVHPLQVVVLVCALPYKYCTEDEMVGWHHWLNGHESEQAPGDGEGQKSLACCSLWGRKELDTTEWLNSNCVDYRSPVSLCQAQNLHHQRQVSVTLQLALHLPWLSILPLHPLPPPLPPPVTLLACSLHASPCVPAVDWTTLLFKVVYCKIANGLFILCAFDFIYYLCEKYYQPITVQYYVADSVSWVLG